MQFSTWILILASLAEVLFLIVLFLFFLRLRRSEELLNTLQANQERILEKIDFNSRMEQDLLDSFVERQEELHILDGHLEARIATLKKLIKDAHELARSPQLLREMVISGHKAGRSKTELAKTMNLSTDEISLILNKNGLS